jgi:hypothetical protein
VHSPPAQPFDGSPDREIGSLTEFDEIVSAHGTLAGFRVRSVDLTGRTDVLVSLDATGAVFLGCAMDPEAAAQARRGGAGLPARPHLPFAPYRGFVYSPDELFEGLSGGGYEVTPDARAYAWSQRTKADGGRCCARSPGAVRWRDASPWSTGSSRLPRR